MKHCGFRRQKVNRRSWHASCPATFALTLAASAAINANVELLFSGGKSRSFFSFAIGMEQLPRMVSTLGVVHVRSAADSSLVTASRRLGGKSLLEWVVRRLSDSLHLDRIVVLCPQIPQTAEIVELVPRGIPYVTSDRPDVLGRLAAALEQHPAEAVVPVAAEHPFVDPDLIDRLIVTAHNHPESDYIGFCSRNGRPTLMSPLGMLGECVRAVAVQRANREAHNQQHRSHIAGFLHAHPEEFHLRLIPVPQELDRDDLRLSVHSEEDWDHVQAIFEALGPENLDYQHIAALLDHQPALRQRMATLNRAAIAV
jgi:spore coat polysaccharide biosynthesis protein SpsF